MAATITIEGDVQVMSTNASPVPTRQEPVKLAYTLEEAAVVSSISVRKLVNYIADGQLRARKNGRNNLITHADLEAFINNLPVARTEAAS